MKVGIKKMADEDVKNEDVGRERSDLGELLLKAEGAESSGQAPITTSNDGEEVVDVNRENAEGVDSSRPSTGGDSVVVEINPLYETMWFRILRVLIVIGAIASPLVIIGLIIYFLLF